MWCFISQRRAWLSLCCFLVTSSVVAQAPATRQRPARAPNPVFAPIEDQPGLPRVLIIGDSISIGYTLDVRKELAGVANVHRIPTNGGPTTNGLKNIDAWLGDSKWDVIHFNWGLHDLKYVGKDGTTLSDPAAEGSHVQVPLEEYSANLAKLVDRMQKTGAKLIWCSTTPVPAGSNGRIAGDEVPFNQAAAKIMAEQGIATNDLCTFAAARLTEIQRPQNVHFTPEGSKVLGQQVAQEIRKALKARAEGGN